MTENKFNEIILIFSQKYHIHLFIQGNKVIYNHHNQSDSPYGHAAATHTNPYQAVLSNKFLSIFLFLLAIYMLATGGCRQEKLGDNFYISPYV